MSQISLDNFDLNGEQQEALETFEDGKSFLLTGPAGTGKSLIISKITERAGDLAMTVGLTAMTGAAALLIGGKTLHSFLGIGLGEDSIEELVKRARMIKSLAKRWKALQLLIVDEVSMLTAELLDKIDCVARLVRGSHLPMGGIQVILIGDFYQLPPVSKNKEAKFCFESVRWHQIVPHTVILKHIMRQSDEIFQRCLTEIRQGSCSDNVIDILQSRMLPYSLDNEIEPTRLYTRNADTDALNEQRLLNLKMPLISFKSEISFSQTSSFAKKINEKLKNFLEKSTPCQNHLHICENAQVMLLHNLDFDNGLVNGSRGKVIGFEDGQDGEVLPIVLFLNGREVLIDRHTWSSKDEDTGFTASISQIPLKLAYSITTHKSQGMSLDLVEIDIGSSVFEAGQAYVALSRVRTLEGLYILDFAPEKIRAHTKVKKFYDNLEKQQNVSRVESKFDSLNITNQIFLEENSESE